jgi:AAA domain
LRLRQLRLARFRQFVDQTLRLDPNVTVIVGRNDTGKTGLLWQFFNQPFYEGVLHSADRPLIREAHQQPIEFGMTWAIEPEDEPRMTASFGRMGQRLDLVFRDQEGPTKRWHYSVDGEDIDGLRRCGCQWAADSTRRTGPTAGLPDTSVPERVCSSYGHVRGAVSATPRWRRCAATVCQP